ncbi:MAG: PQQ-binding-like beta-propeller repeat protein [Proteobacteria bacterium]|nr:PQQ-binding-like beta-propeller repeat protein [Pseudomonadota bacterium]
MEKTKRVARGYLATALSAALLSTMLVAPSSAADVTPERLKNPEPENWLHNNLDYHSTRFSPLKQISKANVGRMQLAFTVPIGGLAGGGRWAYGSLQGTPVVDNGFMYVVDGWGTVYKIDLTDGKSGKIVWVMEPGVDKADVWLPANRGVALWGNSVISVTGDSRVISTNAETGEIQWDKDTAVTDADSLTSPPLVVGNTLLVGGSGGDRGARSWLLALNAESGDEMWRTFTVPAPGEPGSETWKDDNNAWETGGASMWVTGAYDPENNITYWGTGNPVPMYDPEFRPGDNLYSNSTMAIDVTSGDLKWYFQYTPGDYLDYDEVGTHLLYDVKVKGEDRKVLGHFGRNGFYYDLDRNTGQFLNAVKYVDQLNWTDGIDQKTGMPVEYDANKALQEYKFPARRGAGSVRNCPDLQGGVNMFPTSFSLRTNLAYGAGIEGCFDLTVDDKRSPGGEAEAWNGGSATLSTALTGSLTAVDPTTGKQKAQVLFKYPIYSGVLSTAGGIVLTAQMDGSITAHDDQTLRELWSFNAGTGVNAAPMTYAVNGKQYIAIMVGMGSISKGRLTTNHPELANLQSSSAVYFFALP